MIQLFSIDGLELRCYAYCSISYLIFAGSKRLVRRKGGCQIMMQMRRIERLLCRCPELDCSDYAEFPMLDEVGFLAMEQEYCEDSSRVHIFPFVRVNSKGVYYIDVYVWDVTLYPEAFHRYIIYSGYCLPEILESSFLEYLKRDFICFDDVQMESFNKNIRSCFPDWHYVRYPDKYMGQALEHLYYASHRSGAKEILYKADLDQIAYYLDEIPLCNLIGSTPEAIIGHGMPLKLLRILNNHPKLIQNLFSEESARHCGEVYKTYSSYIGKSISVGQWDYLEALYKNGGLFAGHGFMRALYDRLSLPGSEFVLDEYAQFLCLRDEIAEIKKLKLPKPCDVWNVVVKLQMIRDCRSGKCGADERIRDRKRHAEYEYSDDTYSIVMPGSALDICKEAISQGNCVMDYLDVHASGETTILFLRRKDRPEKPFVTVEVQDRAITQVYARHNSLPKKDVYVFLRSFAKARWLLYDPYMLILGIADDLDLKCDEELREYAEEFRRRNYLCERTEQADEISYKQITLKELYAKTFDAERDGCAANCL